MQRKRETRCSLYRTATRRVNHHSEAREATRRIEATVAALRSFVKNSFEAPGFGTLDPMIFGLVRRVFGLICFLLVAYAATTVPVGRRTTWGHLVAIFTAPPAREAAEDLEHIAAGALHRKPETAPAPAGRDPNGPKTRTP
jgi:plasmid stabilization system protein ParE